MNTYHNLLLESQGELSKGKNVQEIVDWVDDLPPFPRISTEALQLTDSIEATSEQMVALLSSDATLASRILRAANSPMFTRCSISSLREAVLTVGFRKIKSLIVVAALEELNKGSRKFARVVWENSRGTAAAASLAAELLGKKYVDEITLLGLLHNLGQFVLLSSPTTAVNYVAVFSHIREQHVDYETAEKEVLGFSHALVGALVAKKWNFPLETCQIILHYNNEVGAINSLFEEKRALVKLGDLIAHAAEVGHPEGYPVDRDGICRIGGMLGFPGATVESDAHQMIEATKGKIAPLNKQPPGR